MDYQRLGVHDLYTDLPNHAISSRWQPAQDKLARLPCEQTRNDHERWGRLVESAVGAHLANAAAGGACEVYYWRERNVEVDFVVQSGSSLTTIEVKSSRTPGSLPGISAFARAFKPNRTLLIGADGIPIEEFLLRPVAHWLRT